MGYFRAGTGSFEGVASLVALGCFVVWCSNGNRRRVFAGGVGTRAVGLEAFLRGLPVAHLMPRRVGLLRVIVWHGAFVDGRANCRSEKRFRNDASASKDKTCCGRLRSRERAFAGRQATCSEQAAILSPRAGRWAHRRRRAVQTTPQRRLPRGDRRRRRPARVRRRKKETAAGAVEPGQCTKGRGREAASG